MEPPFARRMASLGTETAFDVLARARALEADGRKVIHLEMGEPDFRTPGFVVDAGVEALRAGWTKYGPAAGQPDLRAAVAERTAARCGVPVSPEEVVVTPGAKPVLFHAFLALVEEGDEVLLPDTGFPIYESMARFTGGTCVTYRLPEARGFAPDPAEIASLLTPRTKLLVLNSPGNPCGGVSTAEDLEAMAAAVRRSRSWILSDEIYSDFVYEGVHASILSRPGMKERTVLVDGFSKSWAMTGWRAGWGVMPAAMAAALTRLQINATSNAASFTQRAGLAALRGPHEAVDRMVAEFRARRDAFAAGLNTVKGFRCVPPRGAFYAFPSVRWTGLSSREAASRILEEAGVACVAGTAFGAGGEGFVRFSFAASREALDGAVVRLQGLFGRA